MASLVKVVITWRRPSRPIVRHATKLSELPLTFGLGTREAADEAMVEWPSGLKQSLGALRAGRSYLVTEGKDAAADRGFAR